MEAVRNIKVVLLTVTLALATILAGPAVAKRDNAPSRNSDSQKQASQPAKQAQSKPSADTPKQATNEQGRRNINSPGRDNAKAPQMSQPTPRTEPSTVQRIKEPSSITQRPSVTFDNSNVKRNTSVSENRAVETKNLKLKTQNFMISAKEPATASPVLSDNTGKTQTPDRAVNNDSILSRKSKTVVKTTEQQRIGRYIQADKTTLAAKDDIDRDNTPERKARGGDKEQQQGTDSQRRTGQTIGADRKAPVADTQQMNTRDNTKPRMSQRLTDNSSTLERKSRESRDNDGRMSLDRRPKARPVEMKVVGSISENARVRKDASRNERSGDRTKFVNDTRIFNNYDRDRRSGERRDFDRHHEHRYVHRNEHVFFDRHSRLCDRIIWPGFSFAVFYNYGPMYTVHYVHPYYHRKYVFVSLFGYWPDYTCVRYYWYGYYPYQWYGYYPVPYEIGQGDTYNYYTYNYYTTAGSGDGSSMQGTSGQIQPVDENTYKDVREKLAREKAADKEPTTKTDADTLFDEGVKAFEDGDYAAASAKFVRAMELSPDDIILPFAQSQAFFASERYADAAQVLRAAMTKVTPEKEGVFYPRGLYPNDDVLLKQIDNLKEKAAQNSLNADMQLLLGYQLLGIGEMDSAVAPLQQASLDAANGPAAATLMKLLDKIRAAKTADGNDK